MKICHELINKYPALYEGGLANALECLGKCLANVGDDHDAAAARSEAGLLKRKPVSNENPWYDASMM